MPTPAHDLFVAKLDLVNILRGCSDQLRNFMTEALKNQQQGFEKEELLKLYNTAKSSNVRLLDEIELLIKESPETLRVKCSTQFPKKEQGDQ